MGKMYCCLALLFSLLLSSGGVCQSANDSLFYHSAIQNLKTTYYSTIQEKSHLYNGIDYEYFGRGATGTPFFMVDTMHAGAVFYDGVLYEDVPLRYDMVNDVLLARYPKDNNTIQLIKDKIAYFSILDHKFIRFSENEQNNGQFSGFYDLIYNDKKTIAFARRYKKLQFSSNTEDKFGTFVQYNLYFVFKDNKYQTVNSEDDLADVFRDKAQAIKKFMRTEKIKFKKAPEQAIISTATFYNSLSK